MMKFISILELITLINASQLIYILLILDEILFSFVLSVLGEVLPDDISLLLAKLHSLG